MILVNIKPYFYNSDDNMFQSWSIRIVMQNQSTVFRSLGAAKRWSSHPWIKGAQVVMEGIQVLKKNNFMVVSDLRKLLNLIWVDVTKPSLAARRKSFVVRKYISNITCKKSRGVAPSTWRILSYPESWQNSKKVLPNSSRIASAGMSARYN